jgi:HEAT repeat protein
LAAEETVKTEAPPAEVTAEELKDAVFDHVTEKIIFTKALSDMTSQDQTARIDAARAIGGIRHELSVRALIARIAIEPIPQVKGEYIKALATLNMKEGLPVIEHALTDQIPSVRLAAVRALYRVAGAESGPMLIRMFYDEDESIRRRAVVCIGWLGKKEFATALVPLLDDSSILVRQATIEAMVNLCSKMVVSALIDHLGDPEKAIRKAIVAALKSITGKKMSPDAVQSGFPEDEKSIQQLIARWRQWWNTQYPD